jgi:hypothetical protein
VVGLWLGARSATRAEVFRKIPAWIVACSCAACLFFIGVRWGWLGSHLTQQALGIQLDKWQIGPLRVINLITLSIVLYWLRKYARWVAVEPFLTLGKASLQVFCTHLVFVFVGLTLLVRDVGDDAGAPSEQLHGIPALGLLAFTFAGLLLVAVREVRSHRAQRSVSMPATTQSPSTIRARENSSYGGHGFEPVKALAASLPQSRAPDGP